METSDILTILGIAGGLLILAFSLGIKWSKSQSGVEILSAKVDKQKVDYKALKKWLEDEVNDMQKETDQLRQYFMDNRRNPETLITQLRKMVEGTTRHERPHQRRAPDDDSNDGES